MKRLLTGLLATVVLVAAMTGVEVGRPAVASASAVGSDWYRLVDSSGRVFSFGGTPTTSAPVAGSIVGIASTPSGSGYWLAGADGGVFSFGDAGFFGSAGSIRLNHPVIGMAATVTGGGYWLLGRDGGIFSFGDAGFFGSTGSIRLNQPIVALAPTPSGRGYWLAARDGGIFSFGDAGFFGSTGSIRLNQPIVGMAPTTSGNGYWLVAADGGIFSFGDAGYLGSTGDIRLNQPIVGMAATRTAGGYWLAARDGGMFTFGDAAFLGSAAGHAPASVVGMTSGRAVGGAPPVAGSPLATGAAAGRYFSSTSAWNTPVPDNAALDAAGPAIVNYLSSGVRPGVANLYQYGTPIWEADALTPRYPVDCLMNWGHCDLEAELVPIPAGARPSHGSDGAMAIVDTSTGKSYEFWQFAFNGGRPTASWGSVVSIHGPGTPGQAVGAGVSRLAGVVRTAEIAQGRIDHALAFSTDNACQRVYRYPASKTDGLSARTDCIPEGARVQLDPSLNLDTLGLNPGERMVAEALQRYGAFNIDNGGAKMAFVFETPSGEADPYPGVGFQWDYWAMDRIPWSKLRVLRNWDGS